MLVAAGLLFSLPSCGKLSYAPRGGGEAARMDGYARARYEKALMYMEESRFELAREQFAIVAAVAVSPELRRLALDGYAKVGRAIAVRR